MSYLQIENPDAKVDPKKIDLIREITDADVIRDLEGLKDVLSSIDESSHSNVINNIKIVIEKLYHKGCILQNQEDEICKQLFALIMVKHPVIAEYLLTNNENLSEMIADSRSQINKQLNTLNYYTATTQITKWLLQNDIISVCNYNCPAAGIYYYMYNDGQINKYIKYVTKFIDSIIKHHETHFNKKVTYEQYKEKMIEYDISDYIKQKHNITKSSSILIQDIEFHANDLIKNDKLNDFKKLFIVMPRDDRIGTWRNYIPPIAKKYFIYKIGVEILTGSGLYDTFITANFKLILWIWHIIYNNEPCLILELPKDILFVIIKLLSCKIGKNRNKPIVPGIYCLDTIL